MNIIIGELHQTLSKQHWPLKWNEIEKICALVALEGCKGWRGRCVKYQYLKTLPIFQPELTFSIQGYVSDHLIVKMLHNFFFEINLKRNWLGINIGFQLVQEWRLKSNVWYKNKAIQLCHIGQRSGFNPDIK